MAPVSSIAPATPACGAASTAGRLLAEIDVIVDSGIDRLCVESHLRPGENLALPGLDAQRAAAGCGKQRDSQEDKTHDALDVHDVILEFSPGLNGPARGSGSAERGHTG